ncbi:hypothetical protein AcV7_009246 [Taiwanofungus camphoratus]|nr:hypothetical protein AcV7_009246 [Antrodia cinnamomea]
MIKTSMLSCRCLHSRQTKLNKYDSRSTGLILIEADYGFSSPPVLYNSSVTSVCGLCTSTMAANVEDVIMLLGDSLTQGGWEPHGIAQRLAYAYNRKLDIINRGMSGYNTDWIIPVFEQVHPPPRSSQVPFNSHADRTQVLRDAARAAARPESAHPHHLARRKRRRAPRLGPARPPAHVCCEPVQDDTHSDRHHLEMVLARYPYCPVHPAAREHLPMAH